MSDTRGPTRLEADAPAELRSAIDALRADRPSGESLQRMTRNLDPYLGVPARDGHGLGRTLSGLPVKALLVVLAAGAIIAAGLRFWDARTSDVPEHVPERGSHTASSSPTAAPGSSRESERVAVRPDVAESAASTREAATPVPNVRARTGASTMPRLRASRSSSSAPAPDAPAATEVRDRSDDGDTAATQVEAAEHAQPPDQAPTEPQTAAIETPRVDEAALLSQARKLARPEPRAALKTLAEHARLFPTGVLMQEREVLAIELLRALSQTREADRRLAAFRQRHPASVYLPRLERSVAKP